MTIFSSRRGKRHGNRASKAPVKYGRHWAVYAGIALLALGVVVIALAALVSK